MISSVSGVTVVKLNLTGGISACHKAKRNEKRGTCVSFYTSNMQAINTIEELSKSKVRTQYTAIDIQAPAHNQKNIIL